MTVIIIIKLIDARTFLCYNTYKRVLLLEVYGEHVSARPFQDIFPPFNGYSVAGRLRNGDEDGSYRRFRPMLPRVRTLHPPTQKRFWEQYEVRYDSTELSYKEQKSVLSAEQRDAQS